MTAFPVFQVIEAWRLGFHDGRALEHILDASDARQSGTNPADDLRRAAWYLDRLAELGDGRDPDTSTQPETNLELQHGAEHAVGRLVEWLQHNTDWADGDPISFVIRELALVRERLSRMLKQKLPPEPTHVNLGQGALCGLESPCTFVDPDQAECLDCLRVCIRRLRPGGEAPPAADEETSAPETALPETALPEISGPDLEGVT